MKKQTLLTGAFFAVSAIASAQLSFTNQTSLMPTTGMQSSHPVGMMDMNGDNKDDLVILQYGDQLYLHFQNAPGAAFTEFAQLTGTGQNAWGMCAGDVDEDGYSDVLYGGFYDDLKIIGATTVETDYDMWTVGSNIFLQGVNFGDIDNDGHLDIFACHDDGPSEIWLGDGSGVFVQSFTALPTDLNGGGEDDSGNYGSLFTDIDNDGDVDLYIAKCRQGVGSSTDVRRINQLHINNGDGTWTESAAAYGLASGEQTWMADFADLDNDGDMDCLMGQHSGEPVQIYENNGNGTFTDITTSAGLDGTFPASVIQGKLADFDNDGYVDMLVTGSNVSRFYMNNGDMTFDSSTQPAIGTAINSFATGDMNSDGFIDLYATPFGYGSWGAGGQDSLYFNAGNSNNYMVVSLEGTVSNPDAIGARASIYGSWGVQMREVRSGESYGIQNTLNCHFGLGSSTSVDSLVIEWPAGGRDVITNPSINGFTTYTESINSAIAELPTQENLAIFPNPATDQVMVNVGDAALDGNASLVVYNIVGEEVLRYTNLVPNQLIQRNGLAAGLYTIQIVSNNTVVRTGKVVFQ